MPHLHWGKTLMWRDTDFLTESKSEKNKLQVPSSIQKIQQCENTSAFPGDGFPFNPKDVIWCGRSWSRVAIWIIDKHQTRALVEYHLLQRPNTISCMFEFTRVNPGLIEVIFRKFLIRQTIIYDEPSGWTLRFPWCSNRIFAAQCLWWYMALTWLQGVIRSIERCTHPAMFTYSSPKPPKKIQSNSKNQF